MKLNPQQILFDIFFWGSMGSFSIYQDSFKLSVIPFSIMTLSILTRIFLASPKK
jgi:hypothetical protein